MWTKGENEREEGGAHVLKKRVKWRRGGVRGLKKTEVEGIWGFGLKKSAGEKR